MKRNNYIVNSLERRTTRIKNYRGGRTTYENGNDKRKKLLLGNKCKEVDNVKRNSKSNSVDESQMDRLVVGRK